MQLDSCKQSLDIGFEIGN